MSIICTVTPAGCCGATVAWFRSEDAAVEGAAMAVADRRGFAMFAGNGVDGVVPADVQTLAEVAYTHLLDGGTTDRIVEWATHWRADGFEAPLTPVWGRQVPVYGQPKTAEQDEEQK